MEEILTGGQIPDAAAGHPQSLSTLLKENQSLKADFDARVQKILQSRFRAAEADRELLQRSQNILTKLAPRFRIRDPLDASAWDTALQDPPTAPMEGVLGGQSAIVTGLDPGKLSSQMRENIRTRVQKGEKIKF